MKTTLMNPKESQMPMRFIALEEHYWTSEIRDALAGLPPEQRDDSIAFSNALSQTSIVSDRLEDIGAGRLAEMDKIGVDVAVLSVTTPATQILPPDDAVRLSRQANDRLAAAIKIDSSRLYGFATLPMTSPAAAVDELKRSAEVLGFKGAMIHGRTGDRYLDHQNFRPILKAAETLGVPIYIHPQIPPHAIRALHFDGFEWMLSTGLATGGWGWHQETAINALRMIVAGVFDELPRLQVILGHWGETLAFYIERASAISSATKLRKPIKDYLRSNFYITPSGMLSDTYLRFAMEVMGSDRIMFSTDYPFLYHGDGAARTFIEQASITDDDRHKIAHANAEHLLGI